MRYLWLLLLITTNAIAVDVKTYIPVKAYRYLPVLKTEVKSFFPDITIPYYFAGLAEQESCISLTHRKCWDPSSTLNTSRELGVGIFQLTKAYRPDGTVRFDTLSDYRKAYNADLNELAWETIATRPDLQIRTMLLMTKDNYKALYPVKNELDRFKMTDAAYNSGLGSVKKRRLQCGLTKDCDPQIWDNNVGRMKVLSSKPIYGNRSPQMINDEHVDFIFNIRMHKYAPFFKTN
jgi:hypothetical protein